MPVSLLTIKYLVASQHYKHTCNISIYLSVVYNNILIILLTRRQLLGPAADSDRRGLRPTRQMPKAKRKKKYYATDSSQNIRKWTSIDKRC